MSLNDVMAVISRYFNEFGNLGANYVKLCEVRLFCVQKNVAYSI